MRKLLLFGTASALAIALSGCSAFYPNWGATGLPEEPELSQTEQITESTEPAATESESANPEATPAESESSQEPTVERQQVQVDIIMAVAEPDFGVLTVIAQIPDMAETGGKCVMRFIGSNKEATLEVAAEPSSDYTQCFPIEFPLKDLPSGNGIVTVSYESATHFGTSAASSVVIP